MASQFDRLKSDITACTLCAEDFSKTATAHSPRPIFWLSPKAHILIAGQAPGAKVHASGRPFTDPSGDRLRDWMGIDESVFYDRKSIAILPMAFCFPGYNAKGSDLPPPKRCATTWQNAALAQMPHIDLTLLIGGYAQKWHMGAGAKHGVTTTVLNWQKAPSGVIPLPHPSWRNTGWIRKNPWFQDQLLPVLKSRVRSALKSKGTSNDSA